MSTCGGASVFLRNYSLRHYLSLGLLPITQLWLKTSKQYWSKFNKNSQVVEEKLMPTSYKLTDEGLSALVEGKLECKKIANATDGSFSVEYDAVVFSPDTGLVTFLYKSVPIFTLQFPTPHTAGNTYTVEGMEGRISLKISN